VTFPATSKNAFVNAPSSCTSSAEGLTDSPWTTGSEQNQKLAECRSRAPSRNRVGDGESLNLRAIKLLHTVIWAALTGSIVLLPVAGVLRRFGWAAILTVIVLVECAVLAANGGRCPLSDLAARYTDEGASNFDIYLPNWLASHNKTVFGTLFVVNELIALWCWLKRARSSSANDGGTL